MIDKPVLEQADLPKDPTELLRYQVMLLREVRDALDVLQQAQTKTSDEMSLLAAAMQSRSDRTRTKISNIDIPISSLIKFQLRWVVALVPVLLIIVATLAALGGIVWLVMRALGLAVL
ncbi:MAG: hypothetical protein WCI88_09040 [Chloroflexota bacterium]